MYCVVKRVQSVALIVLPLHLEVRVFGLARKGARHADVVSLVLDYKRRFPLAGDHFLQVLGERHQLEEAVLPLALTQVSTVESRQFVDLECNVAAGDGPARVMGYFVSLCGACSSVAAASCMGN